LENKSQCNNQRILLGAEQDVFSAANVWLIMFLGHGIALHAATSTKGEAKDCQLLVESLFSQ
jgi:hypothetical protein